jgi:hypothetical protein
MTPAPWLAGPVLFALLTTLPAAAQHSAAPLTVYSGTFITLDPAQPRAAAIAVHAGRIIAVGSRRHADSVAGPGAAHVVLPGVVLPGLTDAHVHAAMFGELLQSLDLRAQSRARIIEQVRVAAAAAPAGAWIGGGGWDQANWTPPDYPTAADLDSVSAGHPVLLDRIDGHAIWVNTRALQLAAITRATAEPDGGRIIRDASGGPGGVLVDKAADLVYAVVPRPSAAERVRRLRAALAKYAAWGLTSVHDAGVGSDEIAAYHTLTAEGPLPVRVYAMASASDTGLGEVLARGPEVGTADATFTLRSVKVVLDGALGSRGAELSEPYSDMPAERGLSLVSNARLDSLIRRAVERRFQVNVHAIGDQATHRMLDAFERAGAPARSLRFRDEHVSMVRDEDVVRFARLGVIASMQPVFVAEYSRFAAGRVGSARLPWVYRTRDLALAGAVIAAGTDYPAADTGDPIATLYSMVTRRGPDGTPGAGWLPGQRVSVDEALRAMTVNAAYAAFEEDDRGAITVGRRADFTVLSADPYATGDDALRQLRVLRTIVGGRTTYTAVPR